MNNDFNLYKQWILQHSLEPGLTEALNDIINTNIRKVVEQMTYQGFEILSNYISFPRYNNNTRLNMRSSRATIEKMLIDHPGFRSQNSQEVLKSIIYYYETHPQIPRPPPKTTRTFHIANLNLYMTNINPKK